MRKNNVEWFNVLAVDSRLPEGERKADVLARVRSFGLAYSTMKHFETVYKSMPYLKFSIS